MMTQAVVFCFFQCLGGATS